VVSHVRYGSEVFSPIVPEGEGDILFGFELMETCRSLPLIKPGGTVVANDLQISPPSVLMGQETYPADLVLRIQDHFPDFLLVNGQEIAREAGNVRAANTVLLGAVSRRLAIAEEFWMNALEKMVPPKALEVNKKAFLIGRGL
jgi:indolepyruvate ferredoxin oxidoreductase beta subunit